MLRHLIQMPALLLLSMVALVGCARKEVLYEPAGRHEVHFRAHALEVNPDTKGTLPQDLTIRVAVYRRIGATPDPNSDTFIASNTYNVLAGGSLTACTVNPDGTVGAGAGEQLVVRNGTYDFYAYGSATPLTGNTTVEGITHGRDFIAASMPNISVSENIVIPLAFRHQTAQVEFEVRPAQGVQINSLVPGKASLNRMAASPASYTLGTSITPTVGGQGEVCEIDSFTIIDDVTAKGSVITLPKSAAGFELSMEVTAEGVPYTLSGNVPSIAFEAGYHYKFTVRCHEGKADLTLTVVAPWGVADYQDDGLGTGGFGTVEMTMVEGWKNVEWNGEMGN